MDGPAFAQATAGNGRPKGCAVSLPDCVTQARNPVSGTLTAEALAKAVFFLVTRFPVSTVLNYTSIFPICPNNT